MDFNSDSCIIGRGAYGRIVKGKWKGQVIRDEKSTQIYTDLNFQVVAVKEMSSRMSEDRAFEVSSIL